MATQSIVGRLCLCLAVTIGLLDTLGCSRSRSANRVARRRAPVSPPVISEGPGSDSEVPLNLPPAARVPMSEYGAAYGPSTRIAVEPPGSTGASRDIRYRQRTLPRAQTAFVEPRSLPRTFKPAPTPQAPDLPVNVPPAAKRNGNGQKQDTNGQPESTATSDEATGIPHYTVVEANVATGGQPTLDGMKWLKERGFRAVLNLLPDSEADPAEPSMVRELGLEYVSLPITAGSITRAAGDMFNEIVDDAKYRPLFIHDSTGARTGALWYLHRVTVDKVPEDRARIQATRIGLKDTDTELWIAIQRYLSENK